MILYLLLSCAYLEIIFYTVGKINVVSDNMLDMNVPLVSKTCV